MSPPAADTFLIPVYFARLTLPRPENHGPYERRTGPRFLRHGGSESTIHAETAELAVDRLAIMVVQAGTPLNFAEVQDYIRKSIDVIVQLGRVDGRRGITEFFLPGR